MSRMHWLVEHATRGGHVHIILRCGPQPHSRAKLGDLVATDVEWDNDLAPALRQLPNVTFEAAP